MLYLDLTHLSASIDHVLISFLVISFVRYALEQLYEAQRSIPTL